MDQQLNFRVPIGVTSPGRATRRDGHRAPIKEGLVRSLAYFEGPPKEEGVRLVVGSERSGEGDGREVLSTGGAAPPARVGAPFRLGSGYFCGQQSFGPAGNAVRVTPIVYAMPVQFCSPKPG
jgi:hypothetical protein